MEAEPLVSVVTTFLDGQRFIREAIESVLSQSYENWELVLVDDGSTDRSSEVAREYANTYPSRIRYLEHAGHRNLGIPVSRNLGARHSQGAYVAFLDCDDVWLPEKLREQVRIMETHPDAEMVFGRPLHWRSWNARPGAPPDSIPPLWTTPDALVHPPALLSLSYPLGSGSSPCPSDLLVRRECFRRIGGFAEEFVGVYGLFEDQAFYAKVFSIGAVFTADRCWTKYRFHDDSVMARLYRAGYHDHVRRYYLRWLERHLRFSGNRDPDVHRAVARARRLYDRPLRQWTVQQWRRLRRRLARDETCRAV